VGWGGCSASSSTDSAPSKTSMSMRACSSYGRRSNGDDDKEDMSGSGSALIVAQGKVNQRRGWFATVLPAWRPESSKNVELRCCSRR